MQHIQREAAEIIGRVEGGHNLTRALERSLACHPEYSAQQRGALQDLCYGTLRYAVRLAFLRDRLLRKPLQDAGLAELLLVALYQLIHTKAGDHVVVDHAVRAAKQINPAAGSLVNAVLRNFLRQREPLLAAADAQDTTRYSYPAWWIATLKQQYGVRAEAILAAGNTHPPMTLRVNQRTTRAADYLAELVAAGIAARLIEPQAVLLERPVAVDRLPGFAEGRVSVQDAGAQYAAPLLDVAAGMRVLDACAAPGGKAAHLLESAALEMTALDKDEQRLQRVAENFDRLHLSAKLICGDAAQPQQWWDGETFDRILCDAPCSASGVVRRHPDIKQLRRATDIEPFARQQETILDALWPLLVPGGKLLYATCSVFERENQQVIAHFLESHADAVLEPIGAPPEPTLQLLPDGQHDGFFYARLRKI